MNNRTKGIDGEAQAIKYLKSKGYRILDTNMKNQAAEIDIVAQDKDIIVFVEVKMRTSLKYGRPAEAINNYKRRRYIKSAKLYINANRLANRDIRFDVIEILSNELTHIEDAFRA